MSQLSINDTFTLINLIIGVLSLLLAIIIGILFPLWLNQKVIAYEVLSHKPLLHFLVPDLTKDRVQVLFGNKPVTDVSLVVLKIWNSGKKAITKKDFLKPIKLEFGKAEILDARIVETWPDDIEPHEKHTSKSLTLQPDMLGPKEGLKLELLLTKYTGTVTMKKVRGEGMKQIHVSKASAYEPWYFSFGLPGMLCISCAQLLFAYTFTSNNFNKIFAIVLLICSVTLLLADLGLWIILHKKGSRIRMNEVLFFLPFNSSGNGSVAIFILSTISLASTIWVCASLLISPPVFLQH